MGLSEIIFNGRVDGRLILIRAPWVPETFSCAVSGFGPKIYQPAPDNEASRRRRKSFVLRVPKRALNAQSRTQREW